MGWTFGYETKPELKARLTARALHHRTVGNHLWTVEEFEGTPFIALYLLRTERGRAGYKDMTESMHPYYYDCPLSLLDKAPAASKEWRDKVLCYHLEKKAEKAREISRKGKEGKDRVKVLAVVGAGHKAVRCGDTVELHERFKPRKLRVVSTKPLCGEDEYGNRYRFGPRHIALVIKKGDE